MTIYEVWQKLTAGEVAGWAVVLLILFLSVIQISPVKLNPWDHLFSWLGGKLNGRLQKQVQDLWINTHRQTLLTFARECRAGVEHSADEWAYTLNVADEYEAFCEKYEITNGVVRADTRYIRDLYHELSREHKIH